MNNHLVGDGLLSDGLFSDGFCAMDYAFMIVDEV